MPVKKRAAVAAATAGDLTDIENISDMSTQKTPAQLAENATMKALMAATTRAALWTASDIASAVIAAVLTAEPTSSRGLLPTRSMMIIAVTTPTTCATQ